MRVSAAIHEPWIGPTDNPPILAPRGAAAGAPRRIAWAIDRAVTELRRAHLERAAQGAS